MKEETLALHAALRAEAESISCRFPNSFAEWEPPRQLAWEVLAGRVRRLSRRKFLRILELRLATERLLRICDMSKETHNESVAIICASKKRPVDARQINLHEVSL